MSQIINTNRAVRVEFAGYTSTTQMSQTSSADIYVPFPVKEIVIKGVDMDFTSDFRSMYFTSSLVDGNIVGSGYGGAYYDNSTSTKHIRYIFNTPKDINGSFRFDYFLVDNNSTPVYVNNLAVQMNGAPRGYVLFVIEFIGSTNL